VRLLRSAHSSARPSYWYLLVCAALIALLQPFALLAQTPAPDSKPSPSIADQVSTLPTNRVPVESATPQAPATPPNTKVENDIGAGETVQPLPPKPSSSMVPVPAKAVVGSSSVAPTEPLKPKYDVALIGRREVGNGVNFYSLDREMALGRDLSKEVEATSKLITDPVVTEYINRIGQNLVRNSDARVPFTIKVIDNEEVNAFALPGGFFYVDTGLILAADNEAELAAVMAHEIAHVAARHATKNMTRSEIWNLASIPLMFIGGPAGYAIAEVASIAVPMSFLKFSRDAEREADLLGLEYDYAAGYDPQAFVQFFEKLNVDDKKKHSKLAKMFATHPMTGDRVTAAQGEIRQYLPDRDSYIVDTSEFDLVKARLVGMENRHQLNGADSRRPVLLKRTGTSTDADPDSNTSSSPGKGQEDPDRPTLKRAPQQ
jgi:Zn-dependent protease with chaperone function